MSDSTDLSWDEINASLDAGVARLRAALGAREPAVERDAEVVDELEEGAAELHRKVYDRMESGIDPGGFDSVRDLRGEVGRYSKALPGDRRELWAGYSAEQRVAMQSAGVSGPIEVGADAFVPTSADAPGYERAIRRKAAEAEEWAARKDLDLSVTTRERVNELLASAEKTPMSGGRGQLIEEAHFLLKEARLEWLSSLPYQKVGPFSTRSELVDGAKATVQTNGLGQKRVLERLPAPPDLPARPWGSDPNAVTAADMSSWSAEERYAFRKLHPQAYKTVMQVAGVRQGGR